MDDVCLDDGREEKKKKILFDSLDCLFVCFVIDFYFRLRWWESRLVSYLDRSFGLEYE